MPGNPLDDRSVAATRGRFGALAGVTPANPASTAALSVPTLTTITPEEALASLTDAVEASSDGLVVLDAVWRSRLLYANAAARTLLRLPEEDEGEAGQLLELPEEDGGAEAGHAFPRLFTPRERPAIAAHLSSVCDGAGRGSGSGGWLSILAAAGGAERVVECVPRLVIAGGGRMVSVSLRDVTESRRLARRAATLERVAANMTYAGSLRDTLTQLTRDVARTTGLVDCSILLVDDDDGRQELTITGLYGGDDVLALSLLHDWQSGRLPLPPSLRAAQERRPVVMPNVRQTVLSDPAFAAIHESYRTIPWDTTISVPLMFRARVVGVLAAHYAIGIKPKDDDILFLEVVARFAASAVENARLTTAAREQAALAERRRADDALHESEGRFRALVEQSPFAIQIFSVDGHSLHVNKAYVALWGYTDEWFASTDFNVLNERNYRDKELLPPVRRAFEGETVTLPPRFFDSTHFRVTPQAKGRWVRSSYYPLKDGAGAVREVINVFEDVTARMKAEDLLREQEAQYRGIFEATSDGLVITDRRNVVVDVNPAFRRMHGRARDELVGRHASLVIHPSRYVAVDESVRAIDERGVYQTEGLDLRGDGRPFPVEVHATSFTYRSESHILAVVRDTTEQVQARALLEQRVAVRTRELSTLLDISHTVASTLELRPLLGLILDQLKVVTDYNGATVLLLEEGYLRVAGYRGPFAQEIALQSRCPTDDSNRVWGLLQQGDAVIIPDVRADTPHARAWRETNGDDWEESTRDIRSFIAVPLASKAGVLGALNFHHQEAGFYTERHATLARAVGAQAAVAIENARLYARARRLAALEERQRLSRELHDSVSQALYGIALGARTARSLLDRAASGAVADSLPDRLAAPLDYVLSLAEAALAEMRALIFELRPEALERDGIVVALERHAEAVRARHNLLIEADLGAEPDAPYAVKEALYRIAQEALHNAAKHARARTIRLRLSSTPRAGGDGIAALELDVEDDGIGFDPGDEYPGHLGLRTMRERAEAFGGALEIASRPGHGVRLRALVPIDTSG